MMLDRETVHGCQMCVICLLCYFAAKDLHTMCFAWFTLCIAELLVHRYSKSLHIVHASKVRR